MMQPEVAVLPFPSIDPHTALWAVGTVGFESVVTIYTHLYPIYM